MSPGWEDSPVSSPPDSWLHSPFTLRAMEEEEQAEMEEAIEDEVRFRKEHGLPELVEKKEKKKKKGDDASEDDMVHGDLPPQSPLWDYATSESSDEPFSDERRGPAVVDTPPVSDDDMEPIAEANVVNEDVSRSGSQDSHSNVEDSDSSDDEDSDDSDASDVTSGPMSMKQ